MKTFFVFSFTLSTLVWCAASLNAEIIQGQVVEINKPDQTLQLKPSSENFRGVRRIQLAVGPGTEYTGNIQSMEDLRVGDSITVDARQTRGLEWQVRSLMSPEGEEGESFSGIYPPSTAVQEGKYNLETARTTSAGYGALGHNQAPEGSGQTTADPSPLS